jgi:hypothetical protein
VVGLFTSITANSNTETLNGRFWYGLNGVIEPLVTISVRIIDAAESLCIGLILGPFIDELSLPP